MDARAEPSNHKLMMHLGASSAKMRQYRHFGRNFGGDVMRIFGWCLSLLLAGVFVCSSALAQQSTDDEHQEELARRFVLNNGTFVLYHEIGHLLIGELDIPILGREEDAADNLATLLLLSAETVEADSALIDAADGWFLSHSVNAHLPYEDAEFFDVHSLDVQRAFQILCMMAGADQEIFGGVAKQFGLTQRRQRSCAHDFERTSASWNRVLEPHVNKGDIISEVNIVYDPSKENDGAASLLEESQFLEAAADGILKYYDLPRTMTMRGTDCGEENAFYDPDAGEVVFCYELANFYYDMFFYEPAKKALKN